MVKQTPMKSARSSGLELQTEHYSPLSKVAAIRQERRRIDELNPAEYNPRKRLMPGDEEYERLKRSIESFGYVDPIIINADGTVIGGHQRLNVLIDLGYSEADVAVVDLNKNDEKALNIALNKIAGEWDNEKLAAIFSELDMEGYDLSLTGFGEDEYASIVSALADATQEPVLNDPDAEVAPPKVATTRHGDVWKLGCHRLICGDSTNRETIEQLMDGEKSNLVFTDPPYGYQYQSNMRTKSQKFDVLKNDDKILDFMPTMKPFVDGFVFVCTTWKTLDKWLPLFGKYFELTNMVIWDKGGGGIGDLRRTFSTDYEIILCSHNGHELTGKRIGSVWSISKDSANEYVHATQKPVALMAQAITSTTHTGDIVLDVFGGSGSTMIACEMTGRMDRLVELDPKYSDVIVRRYMQVTGKTDVVLIRDGKEIPVADTGIMND